MLILKSMTLYLNTQADLDSAIATLVAADPRLAEVAKIAGAPALRRREPGFSGLAAIVCGQQLSTHAAAAIWKRVSDAFDPFHLDLIRTARATRLARLGLSAAKIKTLKALARELAAERLDLEARPTPKQAAALAERWRPWRGAAAHLWWAYYHAVKRREGILPDDTARV